MCRSQDGVWLMRGNNVSQHCPSERAAEVMGSVSPVNKSKMNMSAAVIGPPVRLICSWAVRTVEESLCHHEIWKWQPNKLLVYLFCYCAFARRLTLEQQVFVSPVNFTKQQSLWWCLFVLLKLNVVVPRICATADMCELLPGTCVVCVFSDGVPVMQGSFCRVETETVPTNSSTYKQTDAHKDQPSDRVSQTVTLSEFTIMHNNLDW